jgi:hypothetical protein
MTFTPIRAWLDVVDTGRARLFVVELELEGGGLVKIWEASAYDEATAALHKIAESAGVPPLDNYSRVAACGTTNY